MWSGQNPEILSFQSPQSTMNWVLSPANMISPLAMTWCLCYGWPDTPWLFTSTGIFGVSSYCSPILETRNSELDCIPESSLIATWKYFLLAAYCFSVLGFLAACRFLHKIQLNCSVNKMGVDNLATVIGVNLIRSKIEDPAVIMKGRLVPWGRQVQRK